MHSDWILLPVLLATIAGLLFLLRRTRVGALLHEHIAERPRRRLFIASVSFFLTFAIVRGMVFCIVHHIPPFHCVIMTAVTSIIWCSGFLSCYWWAMAGCARWEMAATRRVF
jgi:hypothetical protein